MRWVHVRRPEAPHEGVRGGPGVGLGAKGPQHPVSRHADHRQARERLLGQRDPPRVPRVLGTAVVHRAVGGDQPQLPDGGLQRVGAFDGVDPFGQRDHLPDPAPALRTGEVLPDPAAQIGRRPDVEDLVARAAEQVDTGPRRQMLGQRPFAALGGGHLGQIVQQLLKGVDAEVAHSFQQGVQDVDGGARVRERAVVGRRARAEQRGQRGKPVAGRLVAGDDPAGEPDRADDGRLRPVVTVAFARRAHEAGVEGGVVRDEHGAGDELEEGGQHALDAGSVVDHRAGDAGELDDLRRDRHPRIDEGGEFADDLTGADLDRPDLGDPVRTGFRPRGLQVEYDESDVPQGSSQLVEGELRRAGPPSGVHGRAQ